MKTQESAENYLETIFMLGQNENRVRSVDVAKELGYSKPSISIAMKNLRESGFIVIDGDGYINLTRNGQKIARTMYERHTLISDWLISLGVDRETALCDACKIEHDISEQSFKALKKHIKG
ncbi:MAG: metal-dependent transcriptional regulator [Oscillospiraceae bacterium]|nr:metal-dependent transcriptional regulator [Oscillospiraceae bacterium]